MPLSFLEFLVQLKNNPALLGTVLLTLAVLLVNGWTDAPNAIAGVVVTGALPFRSAVTLAAVCNLLGVLCVTSVNASVAETVYSIASFSGGPKAALTALCHDSHRSVGGVGLVVWDSHQREPCPGGWNLRRSSCTGGLVCLYPLGLLV